MRPEQIELIRASYAKLKQVDTVALFYRRLFEIEPGLRTMFKPDMESQRAKFAATMDSIVNHLHEDKATAELRELGRRHRGYGVEDHHYVVMQAAFMDALQECLGAEFTAPVRRAWIAWYTMVAEAMRT